jgi:hypothetical protein
MLAEHHDHVLDAMLKPGNNTVYRFLNSSTYASEQQLYGYTGIAAGG